MFNYSPQHIITVNRGDSFEIPLFINAGTTFEPIRYTLKEGDKVFFAVKKHTNLLRMPLLEKCLLMKI